MINESFTMQILGKPYRVDFCDEMEMHQNLGAANRSYSRIKILSTLSPDQKEDTLLHEVLHMIDKELVLDLEEATIARLAVGLHSAGYRR